MTTSERAFLVFCTLMLGAAIMLLVSIDRIHRWERDAGYPYGRMCDPNIFNGYVDTCRR